MAEGSLSMKLKIGMKTFISRLAHVGPVRLQGRRGPDLIKGQVETVDKHTTMS